MYDFIVWLKNQGQGGFHSPEEIVRALNSASDDKFLEGRPVFEKNESVSSDFRNFKTIATVTLTSGLGDLPADYVQATNASTSGDLKIDIVPESEWIERINDPIDVPSLTKPICAIREQIEVRPITLPTMKLYHLKRPATMIFNYTDDDEGNVTFDASGSVDCDWATPTSHTDIVRRACVYLGIPLNDQGLVRLESFKKQTEAPQ